MTFVSAGFENLSKPQIVDSIEERDRKEMRTFEGNEKHAG